MCDRVTYVNTPYGPIVAAFLGSTWENMKTWIDMSIIISSSLSKLMGDYGVKTELFPKISKTKYKKKKIRSKLLMRAISE